MARLSPRLTLSSFSLSSVYLVRSPVENDRNLPLILFVFVELISVILTLRDFSDLRFFWFVFDWFAMFALFEVLWIESLLFFWLKFDFS